MSSALRREQNRTTGALLIPALLVIIIFTTIPALTTLSYAFFAWDGFQRGSFNGLENFQKLFAYPYSDQLFAALKHNTIAFVVIMTFQTSLGLLFAYAMFRIKRGLRLYRVVVFLPVIFSLVVVGYLWQALLDPFYGPVNQIITGIGLPEFAKPWLGDTATALPTLMFINLWRWVGFPAIVFLAGLNAINTEYIEAARIDGASEGQIFRRIIFPLLAPSLTIITVLTFIGAYEWFDLPFVLGGSNGSPAGATDTLALMFYRLSFGSIDSGANNVGVGSALGVLIFTLVGLGAAFGSKMLRKREVEQ
ncbi:MAG: sugar ABC transporter permease [Candidatus Nanopelagicaceae bacterium]|nr:sugar ABC transporter permease [Candidatus Nanopelagicaceae bacterium]